LQTEQRPWWVFAIQMPLFDTVLQEDHRPDARRYILEGAPDFRSLHWVTYGPAFAALTALALGIVAWNLDIRTQPGGVKMLFACLLAGAPVLMWGVGGALIGAASRKALERQRDALRQRVEITLDLQTRTLRLPQREPIPFAAIRNFRLMSDAGVYYQPDEAASSIVHLIAETNQGQIAILPKELGNIKQKLQILSQLEAIVLGRSAEAAQTGTTQ